ncbi:cytochrome P450 [Archangium violaceum]|uniref:cytochrome P450 n=1 Tax=Archangium violaceum TaxID=83451 RepID=UPI001950B56B|nr:cytochrome P450 [Archangium violaceum]QRN95418.1 cytochrome P450 [Archangium violaceum]
MGFLQEFEAIDVGNPRERAQLLSTWMERKPLDLFGELRDARPIFTPMPGQVLVTRYADVKEVMEREDVFSVRLYQKRMDPLVKGFVLGQDDAEEATREHDISILRLAVSREDLPATRSFTARGVEATLRTARPQGRLDVVRELARPVPTRWALQYFGLTGLDEATLMSQARALFLDIFINTSQDPTIHQEGLAACAKLTGWLDTRIARRRRWRWLRRFSRSENVLDRLLEMQRVRATRLDDVAIRNALIGSITGTLDNVSTSTANIFDMLLDRPELLQAARMAALSDDDQALRPYLMEALRFKPPVPALVRYCERTYSLAQGSPRETVIAKGSVVVLLLSSAMFDPEEVESPMEFRTTRPTSSYLHFGAGPHTCLGRYLGMVLIQELCKGLLCLQNLRRAEGPAGQVTRTREGFPESLEVQFDSGTPAGVTVH